jgi:hypothetical protein
MRTCVRVERPTIAGGRVTEQEPYVPIVREPELPRLAAAARAIEAELERLREVAVDRPDLLAGLYAGRALVADDEHGRRHGLVIQADGMLWAELEELARLAAPALDPARHAGPGTWHPACPDCRGALAAARVRSHRRFRTVGPG